MTITHAFANGWQRPAGAKKSRPASTYRGARRNAARGEVWRGISPTERLYRAPVRPNERLRDRWHRPDAAVDAQRIAAAVAKRKRRAERNLHIAERVR